MVLLWCWSSKQTLEMELQVWGFVFRHGTTQRKPQVPFVTRPLQGVANLECEMHCPRLQNALALIGTGRRTERRKGHVCGCWLQRWHWNGIGLSTALTDEAHQCCTGIRYPYQKPKPKPKPMPMPKPMPNYESQLPIVWTAPFFLFDVWNAFLDDSYWASHNDFQPTMSPSKSNQIFERKNRRAVQIQSGW